MARETGIEAAAIRAYVLGEHGESLFPALSAASVGGLRFQRQGGATREIVHETRVDGRRVVEAKGYNDYAVAANAAIVCESIAGDPRTILIISTASSAFVRLRASVRCSGVR